MSTDDIKRDVDYELKWHPDIEPSGIGVAIKDGAVTLSARLAARAADGKHGCACRGQSEFWRLRTPARAKTRLGAADSAFEIRSSPWTVCHKPGPWQSGAARKSPRRAIVFSRSQGGDRRLSRQPSRPCGYPAHSLEISCGCPILGFAQAVALSRCVIRFVCQRPGR